MGNTLAGHYHGGNAPSTSGIHLWQGRGCVVGVDACPVNRTEEWSDHPCRKLGMPAPILRHSWLGSGNGKD
jgi:hypothetical protein